MRSQRPELRPLLNPSTADCGFRPRDPAEACRRAFQQSLTLHAIGPSARTPEELTLRTSLRERLLTPLSTTVAEYRERLRLQAQQKSVPAMRTYPVVLSPGKDSFEYEAQFESWAEHSRKLGSMDALRASFSEVDVRIERKLRFDFAKVRAKRSLSALAQPQTQFSAARFAPSSTPAAPSREGVSAVAQGQPRSNVADPAAPQLIAGKRGTTGVPALSPRGAGDQADQKCPRRLGNLGGGAPQTPMSSRSEGTLATSQDTGFDPGTAASPGGAPHGNVDPHAHRAEPVEAAVGPYATQGELLEARQQAGRLRDHIHDVDARLGRTATELDELAERTRWIEVPRERGRELGELQRQQAVLQGQLDLLARMQAPAAAPPTPEVPLAQREPQAPILPPVPAVPAWMVASSPPATAPSTTATSAPVTSSPSVPPSASASGPGTASASPRRRRGASAPSSEV
ncbi:hypothetical protein PHYSODRAFT_496191 [Phytophthora sojae]|uniref:Uncharacterized protein n=1 Tax=Phytophthora sojae (strain P6497) TaxID=1094619 RepID=G4Z9V5_PHYSP|nr:hypothetical protein PHYSODRAFT_496191 [Phytophthora sojae]EGZ19808.1 hypothetical protein PHYSODRAFT_496191 [Phytophthora sojae]|eukprot:XP_009522525.1 hypothetical protein PHYSODRAFT_496191 [Phytophthora sojae]